MSAYADSLATKLVSIQRNIGAVVEREGDGEDPGRYVAAADVFELVGPHLARRGIAAIPGVREAIEENGKVRAEVELTLVDGRTGEQLSLPWIGEWPAEEDRSLASAVTTAIKSIYLALFLIPTQGPAEDRNDRRRKAVATAPPVSSSQIRNFIEPAIEEAGISEEDLSALLRDRFGIDELVKLPRASADDLVQALKATNAAVPA